MARFLAVLIALAVGHRLSAQDANAIMAKVAANISAATEARRQYQKVTAAMSQANGQVLRRETHEFKAIPQKDPTEKRLTSFSGVYRVGKAMVPYTDLNETDKGDKGDREEIRQLVQDLVNAKNTRDGIPRTLFPFTPEELPFYKFTLKGETTLRNRRTFQILFEPLDTSGICIHVGGDQNNTCHQWKGQAWIDAEDYQPARIETQLAKGVPWGVRLFMGIDAKQYGFSINYQRLAARPLLIPPCALKHPNKRQTGRRTHQKPPGKFPAPLWAKQ